MIEINVFGQDYKDIPLKLSAVLRADSFVCGLFDDSMVLRRVDSYMEVVADTLDIRAHLEGRYGKEIDTQITAITKPFMHTSHENDPVVAMMEGFAYKHTQVDAHDTDVYTQYTTTEALDQVDGVRHYSSVLAGQKIVPSDKLLAVVGEKYLVLYKADTEGRIVYYNDFQCASAKDYLYYISLALHHLKIDPHSADLVLAGDIDVQSPLYRLIKDYVGGDLSFVDMKDHKIGDARYAGKEHIYFTHFITIA